MKNKKLVVVDSGFNEEYKKFFNSFLDAEYISIDAFFNNPMNARVNLIIFTGGADVDPELYGENKGQFTSINKSRDKNENALYKTTSFIPKIGICRGAQFLTVMNGGKLVQHVEGHANGNHEIELNTKPRSTYEMTSTHHQMMFPFNLEDNKYEMIAWSSIYRSNVYLNGDNKQISLPHSFLEPEIIFYPNSKSLCIQGHPEYSHCPDKTKNLCIDLIDRYLSI